MSMSGMNVAEIRRIGGRLAGEAEQVERLGRAIDAIVQEGRRNWGGPDMERFAQSWTGGTRGQLSRAAAGLRALHDSAVRNAAEQEQASSDTGGGASSPVALSLQRLLELQRQTEWGITGPRLVFNPESGRFEFGSVSADLRAWELAQHWSRDVGPGTVSGDAAIDLGAHGSASASLGSDGLTADMALFLGLAASAGVTAGAGPLAVGAQGAAQVGVRGDAGIRVTPTNVNAHAGAFAGGKVTGEVYAEVGGVKTGLEAEAWAGVGFTGEADFGIHDGKLHIKIVAGAGLGVGAKIEPEVSIDVVKVTHEIKDAADAGERMWQRLSKAL